MNISSLSSKHCKSCTSSTAKLTQTELDHYLSLLPKWKIKEEKLERDIKLQDFKEALRLANIIGEIAEEENHHPDLLVSWGLLHISLSTHAVNGLTENDFILAAKIDGVINNELI